MSQPPAEHPGTVIEVIYPAQRGSIGIRGNRAPLTWEQTTPPSAKEGDRHLFSFDIPPGELLEIKLVRNDEAWSNGPNYMVHAGDHLHIEPSFERSTSLLSERVTLESEAGPLSFQVLLPPSYGEQDGKRYPVLYVQDGQALWSTSEDPFGVWRLEQTVDGLYALGAIQEVVLVAIDTSERRLERLSPVSDLKHGGGEGPAYLKAITDVLRPYVNREYRTRTDRENTGVLGSSMGGLFSFYAAWTRPDVFGKAACLSSSFWWADRHLIRSVQQSPRPTSPPLLYLDSGAALSPLESDANTRDGFHHTRSMVRALAGHGFTPGSDLYWLTFPGSTHDAASWAARIALPLQILFPADVQRLAPHVIRTAQRGETVAIEATPAA